MKLNKKISLSLILILIINFIFLTNVFATEPPDIIAGAAYSVELSTGKVIFERNAHERKYPASTTKIMTALLTLENCELTDTATASYNAISIIPSGYSTYVS